MIDNFNQAGDPDSDSQVPAWVQAAMDLWNEWEWFATISSTGDYSKEFIEKCKEAGAIAQRLAGFSSAAANIGFLPLSFSKYLSRIEELTGIAAVPVLRHFGIADREVLDERSAKGLGNLWRALGFSVREAIATLRITSFGPANVPWEGMRLRGVGGRGALELCESEIGEMQKQATASQLLEQRKLEYMLLQAYGKEA